MENNDFLSIAENMIKELRQQQNQITELELNNSECNKAAIELSGHITTLYEQNKQLAQKVKELEERIQKLQAKEEPKKQEKEDKEQSKRYNDKLKEEMKKAFSRESQETPETILWYILNRI